MEVKKVNVQDILAMKGKRKITMLTAYDYPTAALVDKAGIDMVLVGDSLANVVLGLKSTTEVGMAEMLHHAKAEDCVENARRFIEEAKCDCVKLEWFDQCLEVTRKIIKAGIPVVGHIGLTPQTADKLGGFKVQGKDAEAAKRLIQQAEDLAKLGCFAIVLECVPDKIAQIITEKIKIPTIGIGAGKYTDGQVLVLHDALGLFDRYTPKFVKKYINLSPMILSALEEYKKDVVEGRYPAPEHSFSIKEEELKKL
jgi:3-methyl-2-oxobutanoate hydroxymethyltransferase